MSTSMLTRKNRYSLVILGLLLFAGILGAIWRNINPPPKVKDLSGGLTEQRKRIDRSIQEASKYNLQEAAESLHKSSETLNIALLSGFSPSSFGRVYLNQLLGDRRILAIFNYLETTHANGAEDFAQKNFLNQFAHLEAEWTYYKDNGKYHLKEESEHAASSALLFCSYYCQDYVLDKCLAHWDIKEEEQRLSAQSARKHVYPGGKVDPLLRLNLSVISGSKKGKPIEELNKRLASASRQIFGDDSIPIEAVPTDVFAPNAETIKGDITHVIRGVPVKGNNVQFQLPTFQNGLLSTYLNENADAYKLLEQLILDWRNN